MSHSLSSPKDASRSHSQIILSLRQKMKESGLDGLIVLHNDMYQNEYLPSAARHLAFLTGFTGSAGLAIVLADRAVLFSDSRYSLQMLDQVDTNLFDCQTAPPASSEEYLTAYVKPRSRIGIDPMLCSVAQRAHYAKILSKIGAELVDVTPNPLYQIWHDRPPEPAAALLVHGLEYAGIAAADKIADLAKSVRANGAEALLLTTPESIMWLLNMRGQDIDYNPVALSLAVLHVGDKTQLDWFIDAQRLPPEAKSHLPPHIILHATGENYENFLAYLTEHAQRQIKIQIENETAAAGLVRCLEQNGAQIIPARDPVTAAKAIKNPTEQNGMRQAHFQDAIAMCQFLAWLADRAAGKDLPDEITAAAYLKARRMARPLCQGESFAAISAVAAHAAIVHYHPSAESSIPLELGNIYLIDSGGQYLNATTDVTRTILIGTPSHTNPDKLAAMRECFTRVLKGHIAIATARFPSGTHGGQLDVLARMALWQAGLDYGHGTGHGVGSYLSVHEGPQSISPTRANGKISAALMPGMVISNEPGYYRTGEFGIRIEALVLVVDDRKPNDEQDMLAFETLTLVPIDRQLINIGLLTATEIAWIDDYHQRVYRDIADAVSPAEKNWLAAATRPLTDIA